jgi:endonuclease YncB( thermonuclease family)
MARPEKVRLGEILVQQKLLSEDQLKQALADQNRTGRNLGRVFVESGFVTEEQISGALALVGVGGEDEVADQDRQGARQHERHELGAYGR